MKKRIFQGVTVLLTLLSVLMLSVALLSSCVPRNRTLVVFNWGDYIDESLNKEFEKWYQDTYGEKISVSYRTFETNESMYTIYVSDPSEYDVMCPSDYMIAKMAREGLLQQIGEAAIPNWGNIDPSIIGLDYDPEHLYSVPYTWGTVGILYDPNKVDPEDLEREGFGILWDTKYADKVMMKDSVRDAIVAAVGYLYHDELMALPVAERKEQMSNLINFSSDLDLTVGGQKLTFERELADIERALGELKNTVSEWEVDQGKDEIVKPNSSCVLNLCWSGDATYAIYEAAELNKELAFFIPSEGSNVWVDAWVVSKECKRPDLAQSYINYLLRPESAFRNMDTFGYTSAVKKEILVGHSDYDGFLLKDYMDSNVMYPTAEELAVCAPMLDFNEKEEAIAQMWARAAANRN